MYGFALKDLIKFKKWKSPVKVDKLCVYAFINVNL